MEASDKLEKSLLWYTKVKGFFEPFKPEASSVSLNYKSRSCEIKLKIRVPNGIRRKAAKVEVPAYAGFRVKEIIDDGLESLPNAFRLDGDKWKLETKGLSASEKYLVILEGAVEPDVLKRLVRIQPAKNRDQTEELDRYWLDSMIRDVELLEDFWKFMEVDDVDVSVDVSIEKCFASILPERMQERLDATSKYLEAGKSIDRQKQFGAWSRYRSATREYGIETEKLLQTAKDFVKPDEFWGYLSVDQPYRIGEISFPTSPGQSIFPEKVVVDATTSLDSKRYFATGYLNFKKKLFADTVAKQLKGIIS